MECKHCGSKFTLKNSEKHTSEKCLNQLKSRLNRKSLEKDKKINNLEELNIKLTSELNTLRKTCTLNLNEECNIKNEIKPIDSADKTVKKVLGCLTKEILQDIYEDYSLKKTGNKDELIDSLTIVFENDIRKIPNDILQDVCWKLEVT
jgi:hypothetical protein